MIIKKVLTAGGVGVIGACIVHGFPKTGSTIELYFRKTYLG